MAGRAFYLFKRKARSHVENHSWDRIAIRDAEEAGHAFAAQRGVQRDRSPEEFRDPFHAGFRPDLGVDQRAICYLIGLNVREDIASNNEVIRQNRHAAS